jgi:hypothetical protein
LVKCVVELALPLSRRGFFIGFYPCQTSFDDSDWPPFFEEKKVGSIVRS